MVNILDGVVPSEPDPNLSPVRAWADGEPPLTTKLSEIRKGIYATDERLVEAYWAGTVNTVGAAAVGDSLSDIQLTAIINHATGYAEEIARDNPDFRDLIWNMWYRTEPLRVAANGKSAFTDILDTDRSLIDTYLTRATFAIGATVFKRNLGEVMAPKQQATVIDRAVAHAQKVAPHDLAFPAFILEMWEYTVPRYVEMQAKAFARTVAIEATEQK